MVDFVYGVNRKTSNYIFGNLRKSNFDDFNLNNLYYFSCLDYSNCRNLAVINQNLRFFQPHHYGGVFVIQKDALLNKQDV